MRGAAFGLRQSLDTVGAFVGPLLATALMLLWANDFRAVFWVAVIPGLLAVLLLLVVGIREPERARPAGAVNPIRGEALARLTGAYWWVVGVGAVFTLARFSEAFLVLRASQLGVADAWVPLVMVAMSAVYAATAYPFGKLSDRVSQRKLLAAGLVVRSHGCRYRAQGPARHRLRLLQPAQWSGDSGLQCDRRAVVGQLRLGADLRRRRDVRDLDAARDRAAATARSPAAARKQRCRDEGTAPTRHLSLQDLARPAPGRWLAAGRCVRPRLEAPRGAPRRRAKLLHPLRIRGSP